jgi:hypothetical protein
MGYTPAVFVRVANKGGYRGRSLYEWQIKELGKEEVRR